jgi:hypothetical protein
MKKYLAILFGLSLGVVWLSAHVKPSQTGRRSAAFVPGEIILCFQPGVPVPGEGFFKTGSGQPNVVMAELARAVGVVKVERLIPSLPKPANVAAALQRLEAKGAPTTLEEVAAIFSKHGLDRTVVVRLARDMDVPRLAAELMQRYPQIVESAEPNYLYTVDRTPNDPRFRSQYHLTRVSAPTAWDVTIGSPNVVIAVIDTGLNDHPDLNPKRFINPAEIPGNGVDDDGNGRVDDVSGWDFVNSDNDPDDEFGHGTWVSGVAAAATDNALDVAGMGWNASFLPLKAGGSDGTLSNTAISRSITYATMMAIHGVRVINMSFGGPGGSGLSSIRAANDAGLICVAAAGNGGDDGVGDNNDLEPHFPSSYEPSTDNVIGVASTGRSDTLSSFSNFGLTVGVAAPGSSIITTSDRGSGAVTVDGTSFATPIVSGIAALIKTQFSDITPFQVRSRIEGNVDSLASLQGRILTGGRVNAAKAFEMDQVPPDPITDLRLQEGQPLTLAWTATGDDGQQGAASFYEIRHLSVPIVSSNFRSTTKLFMTLRPGAAGTQQTFTLPDNFPTGTRYVLLRAWDNVGNIVESNQVMVMKN